MNVTVLTSLSYDASLLPAFVAHYAALGASRVVCSTLQLPGSTAPADAAAIAAAGTQIPLELFPASERWQKTGLEAHNKCELQLALGLARSREWFVPADLDEFLMLDGNLPELADALSKKSAFYAMGTLVDRVASDGSMPVYNPEQPIEQQFPVRVYITRAIRPKGHDRKVVLCRGDVAITSGHHAAFDQALKRWPTDYEIAHYAWRSGRLEAIRRRVARAKELNTGAKGEYLTKLEELLSANGGRFALDNEQLRMGSK